MNAISLKNNFKKYLWIIVMGAVVVIGFVYYQLRSFETTDDAFIDGNIVPVSAQVQGKIAEVAVSDNQNVKAGDVLAQIEDRDYVFKRDAASADVQSAQAELKQAQSDLERYQQLLTREEISKQEFDRIGLRVQQAQAQALRAKAKLDLTQLDLERTRVLAPIDGRVSAKSIQSGQYVQVGQPLLSVVSDKVWVVANFKETQMKHMKPGDPVSISIDAYPGVKFTGQVDSVQAGTGAAFSLLPSQNASGNFIKVVQRVPVKIMFNEEDNPQYPLWPGLSVSPKVDVRNHGG
jgi:membrane fusion protein (multidrug efflux system)